jgi:gliding motility-associated-like protein
MESINVTSQSDLYIINELPKLSRMKSNSFPIWIFLVGLCLFKIDTATAQLIDEKSQEKKVRNFKNPFYPDCDMRPTQTYPEKLAEVDVFLKWQAARKKVKASGRTFPVRYTVPVVVHLFEDVPTITDAEVFQAIADLNNAFGHSNNPPGSNWNFDGCLTCTPDGIDTEIEFCLAQRTPDGGVTNGIDRISTEYAKYDNDLEGLKMLSKSTWDPKFYMNIHVVSDIYNEFDPEHRGRTWWTRSKAGGYGSGVGPGGASSTGVGGGAIVSGMGTTLVAHEIGHCLNLAHTFGIKGFGCTNNNCLIDGDGICDTPPDNEQSTADCNNPANSCDTDALSFLDALGNIISHPRSDLPTSPFRLNDKVDMISNFMDYTKEECTSDFSPGQKERMLFVLSGGGTLGAYRSPLVTQAPASNNACTKPCGNIYVTVTQSKRYPLPGEVITFASTATGGAVSSYDWYVEDLSATELGQMAWVKGSAPVGLLPTEHNATLNYTFPANGKYRVICHALDAAGCYASYAINVFVSCGVDARFWPNKRFIAAKAATPAEIASGMNKGFQDTITFFNRSKGADTYTWTIKHKLTATSPTTTIPTFTKVLPGAPPTTDHTVYDPAIDLQYIFRQPGFYTIQLEARSGACVDTTNVFKLTVEDATADGRIIFPNVNCVKDDSLNVSFSIVNDGYDTIPIGTPVSFYEKDPRLAGSKLLHTYYLDKIVYGNDDYEDFTGIKFKTSTKVNDLWYVFNDAGTTTFPMVTPPPTDGVLSSLSNESFVPNPLYPSLPSPSPPRIYDLEYGDNFTRVRNFQFTLNSLVDETACAFSNVAFTGSTNNDGTDDGSGTTWAWTPKPTTNVTCTNCTTATPTITLGNLDNILKVKVTSQYGCRDSTEVKISAINTVLPTVMNPSPICQGGTSPDLAASITGTNLNWYTAATGGTGSTTTPIADTRSIGVFDNWVTQTVGGCESPRVKVTYAVEPSLTGPPIVTNPPDICVGSTPPLLVNSVIPVTGATLRWYLDETTTTFSTTAPLASSASAGTFDNWVSQVVGVSSCEGPRAKVTYIVKQITPPPTVVNPSDICAGESLNLVNSVTTGGPDLRWYTTALGGLGTASITPITTIPNSYDYWVSQVVNGCESDRVQLTYIVKSIPPEPVLSQIDPVCVNATPPKLATMVSGNLVQWYSASSGGLGSANAPTASSNEVGTFNYWVSQTINGCEGPRAMLTYSVESIDLNLNSSFTIDEGQSQELNAGIFAIPDRSYSVLWWDADNQNIGTTDKITVSPIYTTDYFVKATSTSGCEVDGQTRVNVINKLYPAQIFSPNGDGANETWEIRNIEEFPNALVTVYNRWGSPVFKSKNYGNTWNGTLDGNPLPIATYYYVIDMTLYGKNQVTGSVTIIR